VRFWSVPVSADRYATERLYLHETIDLHELSGAEQIAEGDGIALVAEEQVFGLGSATEGRRPLRVAYRFRLFDEPRPAASLTPPSGAVRELTAADFRALTPEPPPPRRSWLVRLDLPIEASTPAEAVRQFWSYVHDLGPAELPAFVSPGDDELAMQAFVLGAEANQDPED
jgi:hypothetical protein